MYKSPLVSLPWAGGLPASFSLLRKENFQSWVLDATCGVRVAGGTGYLASCPFPAHFSHLVTNFNIGLQL